MVETIWKNNLNGGPFIYHYDFISKIKVKLLRHIILIALDINAKCICHLLGQQSRWHLAYMYFGEILAMSFFVRDPRFRAKTWTIIEI